MVVTPEYRLPGKAPYPAALENCYIALKYLKENAEELGCNQNQIMIGGESAGGGLTVALCMYARDKGGASSMCGSCKADGHKCKRLIKNSEVG